MGVPGASPIRQHAVRSGFTLVELLVVIGIITLLLGVLIPMVSKVRRSAGQLRCAANLQQWTTAVTIFAARNQNNLPRRGQGMQPTTVINRDQDWFNALPTLISQQPYQQLVATGQTPRAGGQGLWLCPQAPDAELGYMFTYGMNMRLSTWVAANPDKIDRVGELSTMVFMSDAPSGYCSVLPSVAAYSASARHDGKINIAFLDGHVATYSGQYVGCGVGDPQRADVRWIVPNSPWPGPPQ